MNEAHLLYLAGPDWQARLESELVPWIGRFGTFGDDVLEIGPGPGLTTDILLRLGARITALELDRTLAEKLSERMRGRDVNVVLGDACAMGFASNRFSAVTAFSMLHHVPRADLQDRVLGEAFRVLAEGGRFFAVDPRDSEEMRQFHTDDTFVPLPLATIVDRLENAGFKDIDIHVSERQIRFSGCKH
jgi:SAM-dependent methyltransferase